MKGLINKIKMCEDINIVKNVVAIMLEFCDAEMNGKGRLLMLKEMRSELEGDHYDEELADLHLALIGMQRTKETALRHWRRNSREDVSVFDWFVLWGEMLRIHERKIRLWFPNITTEELEGKLFDECMTFLDNGRSPFRDLGV